MIANMGFNILFVILLGYELGFIGLAMATSCSALLNVILLYQGLHRGGVFRVSQQTLWFVSRVVLATAAMGYAVFYLNIPTEQWLPLGTEYRIFELLKLLAIAAVVYPLSLLLLGFRPRDLQQ